ncbi:cobalamin-binding protein [Actinoplanes sp. SE50]|uniref:cobalamin B12-binding domain-containing protein n=1 Tax=unclassified Actinoplanes TaxID=2626549 RepID=UPI00023ED65B|nr:MULTISPECIES: cobalamin B12-binding domain-containing protein [unclassified Actinoplanes]AEV86201.1 Methionine synthase [Actinoplanes sp. SE50/110]ATO84599.1 cobalamin-binding protein [Actinoplanes sp. SE50]SLM02009.1 cobalamin-binding protein [Actinoplanes sp. SE50/110]
MITSVTVHSLDDPDLHDEYLRLVGDGDEYAAVELALTLLDNGVRPQRIMVDLIGGTQARVGELWAANEWSVAREHAATAVNERVLAAVAAHLRPSPRRSSTTADRDLSAADRSPATADRDPSAARGVAGPDAGASPADRGTAGPGRDAAHAHRGGASTYRGRITVACVDGEWHGLPARILAELLSLDGWRVDFLGASVPGPHLITHLHQTGPDAVALSCMIPTRLPRAHAAITACRAAGVPVIAGGRGFGPQARWAARLGADAWATSAEEAVVRLATDWPPPPAPDFPASGGFVPSSLSEHLGDEEYTHLVRSRPQLIDTAMQRLAAVHPEVRDYDDRQREATAEDFGHIADFLAASLYIDEPQIFRDFTSWTADVLTARLVPVTALRAGLHIVRDQLIDFPTATKTLDLALADLSTP